MSATRRGLLAAAAALPIPGEAAAAPHPDAELIRLCAEFSALYDRCGDLPEGVELDENCPEWMELQAVERRIETTHATTLAGLIAKATVPHRWARQPDGSLDFGEAFTGRWPELVVQDLLRMAGGAA